MSASKKLVAVAPKPPPSEAATQVGSIPEQVNMSIALVPEPAISNITETKKRQKVSILDKDTLLASLLETPHFQIQSEFLKRR